MQKQTVNTLTQNNSISEKVQYGPRGTGLLRTVTLSLTAHVVELIEEMEGLLETKRTDWFVCPPEQYLELGGDFASFVREFEYHYIDGAWTFEDAADRARFMEPILPALRTAFEGHQSAQPALA